MTDTQPAEAGTESPPDPYEVRKTFHQMNQRIANNVNAALAWRGMKGTSLVGPLGLSQAGVSRRLTARTPFDIPELSKIAEIVGVSTTDLIYADPWRPADPADEPAGVPV